MATLFTPTTEFVNTVDGLEAVTIKYPGTAGTTSVTHAKRRQVSTREAAASGGRYTTSDVSWHLPQTEATTRPKLGSKIVDSDSVYWTVLSVDDATRSTRWRCVSRALAIVAGLDTYVTVQRARYSKGQSGAAQPTWKEFAAGVKARIQPEGGDATVLAGAKIFDRRFRITLETEVAVDQACRIIGSDGAIYNVKSTQNPQAIDELFVVMAEQTQAPEGS